MARVTQCGQEWATDELGIVRCQLPLDHDGDHEHTTQIWVTLKCGITTPGGTIPPEIQKVR